MEKKMLLFLLIIFLIFVSYGYAKTDEPLSLKEMVVTASRYKESKKELATNVTIITEDEIKASTAKDLGELLAEMGIGHIHMYPGALTSVGIRGFRTETHGNDLMGHVLILLDGRRAGTGNVAKILTKNIERIEIIRGPGAVQYGSAGMGGVINVITKKGKGKPHFFAEGTLGSFDYDDFTLGADGKIKNFDFSLAYFKATRDDYDTAEGERYYNTDYKKQNYSINLGYEFFPNNRIGVIYTKYDADKIGSPGYLTQNDLDDYKNSSLSSADVIYTGGIPSLDLFWKVRYFEGDDIDEWHDPVASNPDFWDDGIPSKRKTEHKGAQAQISLDKDLFFVNVGSDWVYYKVETTWAPHQTYYKDPAFFMLAKLRLLNKKLIISGGARYDKYKVEVGKGEGKDKEKNHICPSIGMSYLLTDNIKIRANYAHAYRMPSAKELAADYVVWGTRYKGNHDLDPERSWTAEGGIDLYFDFAEASLTYFYTHFKDKIESQSSGGVSTWVNKGEAKIDGVEFNFSLDVGKLLELDYKIKPYGNIVYLFSREDEEEDKDLKYVDKFDASWGIFVAKEDSFCANLNFSYTGNQWIEDWEKGWPPPVIKRGGFMVADFSISTKILKTKFGKLTLKGEVKNLFDRNYSYVKGYPMPGRTFFIGLRYDY